MQIIDYEFIETIDFIWNGQWCDGCIRLWAYTVQWVLQYDFVAESREEKKIYPIEKERRYNDYEENNNNYNFEIWKPE